MPKPHHAVGVASRCRSPALFFFSLFAATASSDDLDWSLGGTNQNSSDERADQGLARRAGKRGWAPLASAVKACQQDDVDSGPQILWFAQDSASVPRPISWADNPYEACAGCSGLGPGASSRLRPAPLPAWRINCREGHAISGAGYTGTVIQPRTADTSQTLYNRELDPLAGLVEGGGA